MRRFHRLALAAALLGAIALPLGCSGTPPAPKTVAVSGRVTYNGQPLTKGLVSFIPAGGDSGTAHPTTAPIQPDGAYRAASFTEGDGLVPGQYKIVVTSDSEALTVEDMAAGKKPTSAIPQKYTTAESTPLTLDVKDEGKPIAHDVVLTE